MNWLPVNTAILKSPYNWLVVSLMVVIVGLALHLIFGQNNSLPTTDGTQP